MSRFAIIYGVLYSLVVAFLVFSPQTRGLLGATILTTASSDTLTTFRTNVNTSLTNLNNAITGIVSTSSPLTAGNLLYATGVNTMAGVATTSVTCSGGTSCTSFTAIGPAPITISSTAGTGAVATSSNEVAGQIPFFTSSSGTPALIGGSSQFTWNNTSKYLSISTTTGSLGTGGTSTLLADVVAGNGGEPTLVITAVPGSYNNSVAAGSGFPFLQIITATSTKDAETYLTGDNGAYVLNQATAAIAQMLVVSPNQTSQGYISTDNGDADMSLTAATGIDGGFNINLSNASLYLDKGSDAVQFNTNSNSYIFNSKNFGVGTTSPLAKLSVHGLNGDTNTNLFLIASSTASATTTLFSIGNTGTIVTSLGSGLVGSGSGVLYSTSTSSPAFTYPLQTSGTFSVIGSAPTFSLAFGTTTSNTWAGTQTFTNAIKIASLSGLIAGNSGTTYVAATSTLTAANGLTGTFTQIGSGGSLGLATINAGVLGAVVNGAVPSSQATSTLYGASTGGKVLGWNNTTGGIGWIATSTASGASVAGSNGQVQYNAFGAFAGSNFLTIATSSGAASFTVGESSLFPDATLRLGHSGSVTNGFISITGPSGVGNPASYTLTLPSAGSTLAGLTLAQTWTALQTFSNASSTLFSAGTGNSFNVYGNGNVGVASSSPSFSFSVGTGDSAFYISTSTGKVVAYDATNGWNGRISPTRSFALSTGTTTTWTASTTGTAYSPFMVMPFTGTVRQVRCSPDASFLGVNVQVNGSNATPSYFVASTTVGIEKFTAGNTFSAGQKILMNVGTTTTATATSITCTFDVTET